jgi:hypothetical protein
MKDLQNFEPAWTRDKQKYEHPCMKINRNKMIFAESRHTFGKENVRRNKSRHVHGSPQFGSNKMANCFSFKKSI